MTGACPSFHRPLRPTLHIVDSTICRLPVVTGLWLISGGLFVNVPGTFRTSQRIINFSAEEVVARSNVEAKANPG